MYRRKTEAEKLLAGNRALDNPASATEESLEKQKEDEAESRKYCLLSFALLGILGFYYIRKYKSNVQNYIPEGWTVNVGGARGESDSAAMATREKASEVAKTAVSAVAVPKEKAPAASVALIEKAQAALGGARCEWQDEILEGRCMGLRHLDGDYPTAASCGDACCEAGWECFTWQWRKDRGCFLGDIVRVGLEGAPTGNWCEPTKPATWMGKRLKKRNGDGTCMFQTPNLSGQCYGLGVKKPPETPDGCEQLCCETQEKECTVWQFREDKGCFIGKSGQCDEDVISWIGRRRPVPEWRKKGNKDPPDDAESPFLNERRR